MYRSANATLIGEAVVRVSKTGDFELTLSKGPGITLLSLRQDADFAEFRQTSRVSIGPVPWHKRHSSCVAGSACAINSFARPIKRGCDTSAAARPFCSASEPTSR
jgi:hypothetical protein